MPSFSNRPPEDPRGNALPLLRTPPTARIQAIVTSVDLIGTFTHYWHGRTMPCDTDDCEACRKGVPFRWHAWMSVMPSAKYRHALFEMTAQAAQTFVEYRETHGTLRGCLFEAWRPSRRPNGRVFVSAKPADLSKLTLPKPADLIACLSIIWNVAQPDIDITRLLDGIPHVKVVDDAKPVIHTPDGNGRL